MKKSRRFCQTKKSCVSCKRYTDHLGGKMNCFLRRMTANFKDGMVMPNRFLNHFEGKISGTIKLESPNGNLYDVEVAEHMNKTVLRCGWEAFVDAHHIEENDSVLFRHIENSHFEVLILDSDDCEKVIPCSGIKNISCVQERRVGSDKISSSSCDDTTQSSGSKRFARCRRGSSSHRREIEKMAVKSCSSEESGEDSPSENESFESDGLRSPPGPDYVLSRRSYLSDTEKDKVFALIQKIQPEVTVFVAIMRKCSVQPSAPFVVISKDYAAVHFPHGSATVTLQRPDKCKKWRPRFYKRKDGSAYMLRGNWLDFVRDNRVQEGDICLFVPMKGGGRFTFTVHLLHAEAAHSRAGTGVPRVGSCHGRTITKMAAKSCSSEESGEDSPDENESFESDDLRSSPGPDYVLSRRSYLSDAEKDKVFALIQKIQPEVTVFVAIMRKCNVQPSAPFVVIAKDYAAVHFPHGSATVTLQRPDKCKKWRPRLYKRKDGSAYMLRGNWLDFVRDNRVQEGDICLFVPTKGGRRFTFTVHLLHAAAAHSRAGTGVQRVGSCHGRIITKMASAVHIKEEPTDGENASSSESDKHGVSHESLESMDSDDPPEPSYILPLRNCLSQSQKKLVEEKVRAIRSKIPIYVAIMKNVPQHHTLEFASRYADLHLPGRKQTLVLQCMGKVWKTKMLVSNRNRWFLSAGWSKFTRDNRLRVGDICLFELKKNERKLAMTVHIIFSEQC